MIGTSSEIIWWMTFHYQFANALSISRQRLVSIRNNAVNRVFSQKRIEEFEKKLQNFFGNGAMGTEAGHSLWGVGEINTLKRAITYSGGGRFVSIDGVTYTYFRIIRPRVVLPAVVRDHKGKFFSEVTFLNMVKHEEKMRDLHLYLGIEDKRLKDGLPNRDILREALRRKGWNIFAEREELPAIWEIGSAS